MALEPRCVPSFDDAWPFTVGSATLVLGAARLFPKFKRSLSVSSKTALIVSQAGVADARLVHMTLKLLPAIAATAATALLSLPLGPPGSTCVSGLRCPWQS